MNNDDIDCLTYDGDKKIYIFDEKVVINDDLDENEEEEIIDEEEEKKIEYEKLTEDIDEIMKKNTSEELRTDYHKWMDQLFDTLDARKEISQDEEEMDYENGVLIQPYFLSYDEYDE